MNETLIVPPTETITHSISPTLESSVPDSIGFDFMMALRIIWYLFCIIKIISIAFFARPKPSIRQRVLRKFLISHSELLKSFTEEDKKNMEVILDNTIKNAASRHDISNSRIRKQTKSVIFQTDRNDYYEPKKWKEQEDNVFFDISTNNASNMHLSSISSFQQKKYEEQYIERQDLIGLNEKTQDIGQEKQKVEEKEIPKEDKEVIEMEKEIQQEDEETSPLFSRKEPKQEQQQAKVNSPLL